jgi:hypothetical protein
MRPPTPRPRSTPPTPTAALSMATACEQVVDAAELTQQANDFQQLAPMLTAIRTTLASAGICDPVQRLAADSGYWSIANVSAIPDAPELLIPPARHGRHGKPRKDGKPSVSTSDSLRAAMLARLGSERARSATSSVAGPSNRSSVRSRPSRAAAGSCAAGCWPVRPNGSCCAALTTGETHLRNALRMPLVAVVEQEQELLVPLAPGVWEGRGQPAWGRPGGSYLAGRIRSSDPRACR